MSTISIDINEYKYLQKETVLKDIHVQLKRGTFTTILGPSGCGKSTLLRVLMGIEKSDYERAHSFSLVPQTPHLFPWKTVFENVLLGLFQTEPKMTQSEIVSRVSSILDTVGLKDIEKKYPYEISVGMCQRVSFARAMINPFEVLLLDEPFSALDALTRYELQNWLLAMMSNQQGYGLFVTHDIAEAISLSHNIYIFSRMPATVIEHFVKDGERFVQKSTGKIFQPQDFHDLEKVIFSFYSKILADRKC